ncbi:MAG: methyltransferase domain-containing protein [Pseudomonadota bacterium]
MTASNASDDETLAFYDAHAETYADAFADARDEKQLARFIARLPEGGHACDLGAGSGWAAAYMKTEGFAVTALDGSAGLAAQARRRYGLDVTVMRFEEFNVHAVFDGIWAAWSLHHAPRAAFPDILTRVVAGLKTGGVLYLAMKGGRGEGRDKLDRLYAYYEADELRAHLSERGMRVETFETFEGPSFDGSRSPLHAILATKAQSG